MAGIDMDDMVNEPAVITMISDEPRSNFVDNNNSTPSNSAVSPAPTSPPAVIPTPLPTIISDCPLSDDEQLMLSSVNNARSQARLCGDTSFAKVPALQWNCTLKTAALNHSLSMATQNFFSHTGTDGLEVWHRVENLEYQYRNVGENIARGQSDVAAVMQGWLKSPGHCSNIMSPKFQEMGSAVAINPNNNFRIYWAQVFGTQF